MSKRANSTMLPTEARGEYGRRAKQLMDARQTISSAISLQEKKQDNMFSRLTIGRITNVVINIFRFRLRFMAIIKKNDVTPERPVIIVLYGTPGTGKTSVSTTAENPVLVDTDRGFDRAVQRVDTLVANNWQDIANETNTLKGYKTIVVDTAKAMLDDYLSAYAVQQDPKLAYNTLKRFGRMADDFKLFVNTLRNSGADLIFICHDKEEKDGDNVKHSPDCTGQSKDLLIRIADQVGYVCKENGKRVIKFEPQDCFVGKNVAKLDTKEVPDCTSEEFPTFMAGIVTDVKKAIQSNSEATKAANELLVSLRDDLDAALNPEDFDACLEARMKLPAVYRKAFAAEVNKKAKAKGFTYNKEENKYQAAA